jgi:hypothetical protein
VGLVKDSSVFGATSPIMGQRFRLDASPTLGTIRYTGITADLRRYLMPIRPVTIAARLMHYGRYGSGAEDPRSIPSSWAIPISSAATTPAPSARRSAASSPTGAARCSTACSGSRLLVGNLEVRAPLLGLFGKRNLYGPIPVEIGAFFDAGVAWDSTSKPALFGGDRALAKSTAPPHASTSSGRRASRSTGSSPSTGRARSRSSSSTLLTGF